MASSLAPILSADRRGSAFSTMSIALSGDSYISSAASSKRGSRCIIAPHLMPEAHMNTMQKYMTL